jgi:hypothetical protein
MDGVVSLDLRSVGRWSPPSRQPGDDTPVTLATFGMDFRQIPRMVRRHENRGDTDSSNPLMAFGTQLLTAGGSPHPLGGPTTSQIIADWALGYFEAANGHPLAVTRPVGQGVRYPTQTSSGAFGAFYGNDDHCPVVVTGPISRAGINC